MLPRLNRSPLPTFRAETTTCAALRMDHQFSQENMSCLRTPRCLPPTAHPVCSPQPARAGSETGRTQCAAGLETGRIRCPVSSATGRIRCDGSARDIQAKLQFHLVEATVPSGRVTGPDGKGKCRRAVARRHLSLLNHPAYTGAESPFPCGFGMTPARSCGAGMASCAAFSSAATGACKAGSADESVPEPC